MKGLYFFVYIITNPSKTILDTGVTNNLKGRLEQHYQNRGNQTTFAGKFYYYQLLYFETFSGIQQAIAREKEIKGWARAQKGSIDRIDKSKVGFSEI